LSPTKGQSPLARNWKKARRMFKIGRTLNKTKVNVGSSRKERTRSALICFHARLISYVLLFRMRRPIKGMR
jgi:hypothetical protein